MIEPFFEILDTKRKKMLPLLRRFKDRFYLAGGTGLALQLAHRDSVDFDCLNVADIDDIACMKIVALLRAEFKDYVDLYFIFKDRTLNEVIENCRKKYDQFDEAVYLKALVSFDDINVSKILFERGKRVKLSEIKNDFEKRVKEYLADGLQLTAHG